MAEWFKAAVLKTAVGSAHREFESHRFRQNLPSCYSETRVNVGKQLNIASQGLKANHRICQIRAVVLVTSPLLNGRIFLDLVAARKLATVILTRYEAHGIRIHVRMISAGLASSRDKKYYTG